MKNEILESRSTAKRNGDETTETRRTQRTGVRSGEDDRAEPPSTVNRNRSETAEARKERDDAKKREQDYDQAQEHDEKDPRRLRSIETFAAQRTEGPARWQVLQTAEVEPWESPVDG